MSIYKRVTSGMDFLDAAVGGLFSKRTYLLRGASKSGRTTASLQFLVAGIENGENGLMISNDRIENVILKAEAIGIYLEPYLMDNRLVLMEYPREITSGNLQYKSIISLLGEIENYLTHYNCQRLAIDTIIPLLANLRQTPLVNYIYSLMNSLETYQVTTLVTTGDPNSPMAARIIQLIEDAVAGSFSLTVDSPKSKTGRQFLVHKLVNQFSQPLGFDVQFEFGVGLQQYMGTPETSEGGTVTTYNRDIPINELPLRVLLVDRNEECLGELEEIFSSNAQLSVIQNKDEFMKSLPVLDCDILIINAGNSSINWQEKVIAAKRYHPKLPMFIIADRLSQSLTYKTVKISGADALFTRPISTIDFFKAIEAVFRRLGIMDDIYQKYSMQNVTYELPDDVSPITGLQGSTQDVNLIPIQLFKEKVQLQILRSQGQKVFTLVSFKMAYTSDISGNSNLPQGLELVKKVATVVTLSLRGMNDIATRYMDKIVVLLEDTDREGANAFAKRVIRQLSLDLNQKLGIQLEKQLNILTAFSVYPADGENVKDLMIEVAERTRNFLRISA